MSFMFSPIYLRLEGNVLPPHPGLKIFFKHECYGFLSILVMGNLPPLPCLPIFLVCQRQTVKRKPLIFNFKWNFGWILGQHDILVLGDVTPPPTRIRNFFLSKIRFELANVPPPQNQKIFFIQS